MLIAICDLADLYAAPLTNFGTAEVERWFIEQEILESDTGDGRQPDPGGCPDL
jgi:hypothetical protein